MTYKDLVPKRKEITNSLDAKQSFECIGFNRAIDKLQPLYDYIEKFEAKVEKLEAENKRLSNCHEAELGVCKQHCKDVIELKAKVEKLEAERDDEYERRRGYEARVEYLEAKVESLDGAMREIVDYAKDDLEESYNEEILAIARKALEGE